MPTNDLTNVDVLDPGEVHASESERTLEGYVLPWGAVGSTHRGQMTFPRGSVNLPSTLSKVKLLAGHSPAGVPVGHAIHAEDREDGLYMRFQLGSHAAAQESLVMASEHTIDAFSVEVRGMRTIGNREAREGLLKAVALVPFPAFDGARVDTVNAEESEDETPTEDTEDTTPDESEDTTDEDNSEPAEESEDETPTEDKEEMTTPIRPAFNSETDTPAPATLERATELIMAAHTGTLGVDELHAELVDITGSNSLNTVAPGWLGELWSGVVYDRRVIPLIQNAALRNRKATGFKWKTKPTVAKWAGDKTEIHSSPAAWENVEVSAQPWAGGNDLDRQIFDFNEADTLRAYWAAMAESYAFETDKDTAAFLAANATDIQESAPDLIRAITRGAIRIDNAVHVPASFALVNPNDLESVLDFSQLDVPHYTGLTPVSTPDKWVTSEFVEPGTALVGAKQAATFYELPGSPLRVQAEHIAKGGRDAALFGYTAHLLNRPEALVKVHFAKSSTTAPAPVTEGTA